MAKKRAHLVMVAEDDSGWLRFWDKYPHRRSKKDARKAWADISPSPELVERILAALTWQIADWENKADWYTPPYPASWLRAERWEDEPPRQKPTSKDPWWWQFCEHTPKCNGSRECSELRRASA